MFNYPKVTRMDVYRTDDKPITLSGGTFITISGRENIFPFDEATGERKQKRWGVRMHSPSWGVNY
jgi:hypothetical protein